MNCKYCDKLIRSRHGLKVGICENCERKLPLVRKLLQMVKDTFEMYGGTKEDTTMGYVSMIDGHIDEPRKQTNYDRIRNMSIEQMAMFLAQHIDHYRAPYEVKELYANAIDNKTGNGIIWIEAFKRWLESEVTE